MSLPLLRHAAPRLSHSLAATCRSVSQSRYYAASAVRARTRHEAEQRDEDDDAQVAGPSSSQREPNGVDSAQSKDPFKGIQNSSKGSESFSRVESYLASINASGLEPTLDDLERCRPPRQPPPHSPRYVEVYTELLNTLCRSFTKEQLRTFLVHSLGTSRHCATHRRKADYAESIIEQLWKWPTLKAVEKAKRDRTEIATKTFPVTASDLFLILGRDGTDLLRMSKDYDVHISLRRNPMALLVEGTRGSLRELTEHLLTLKKSFVEETYVLPLPMAIPEDMVQRISRLASAYLENDASVPGKLKIVAKGAEGLASAKRLASRAVHEIEEISCTPLLTYIPPGAAQTSVEQLVMFPHDYALYPYLSPRPLPFIMNTSGTFRLRRVGEWLASDFREDIDFSGGLAGGKGHVLTVDEEVTDLKRSLLGVLPNPGQGEQPHIAVKASMGHMLLTRPSGEQRATLVPPLAGPHPFGKVRQWIAQNPVKMTFVPDLPLPLLDMSPHTQRTMHRLVYHALPTGADNEPQKPTTSKALSLRRRKVLTLQLTLTKPAVVEPSRSANTMLEGDLEKGLSALAFDNIEEQNTQPPSSPGEPSTLILEASGIQCWTGVEADLNLMMPDRPMDLQFTARSSTELPEERQPAELQQYVAQLRAYLGGEEIETELPRPPLLIEYAGERYILHSNSSVRQSEEVVSDSAHITPEDPDSAVEEVAATRAVCESTLDLETNQKSMHCEVTCEDVASEEAWSHFLRDCDKLSLLREQPKRHMFSTLDHGQDDLGNLDMGNLDMGRDIL